MVDDIGERIGGQGLGDMMGGAGGGVGEKTDRRDKWGWAVRNSSTVGMLFSRVNEVSSLQARVLADHCWRTVVSSSSSSEEKKSDNSWLIEVLGRDSGYEGFHQLVLFKMEMVKVCEGTMLVGKARSFVMLGPG